VKLTLYFKIHKTVSQQINLKLKMTHNLFLGMYTFSIKKIHTSNSKKIEINDYLSQAYTETEDSKFGNGFVQDVISFIDQRAYKNDKNTHGGILADKSISVSERTLDLLIDGGITGIKQFIIDESGNRTVLSDEEIIGPKFFCRIWLPANTNTGYLFIQKYGSLSIKPLFDSIIKDVLKLRGFSLVTGSLKQSTTKARQKEFLKKSTLKDITIVSKNSSHNTGAADASTAEIRLKNFIPIKGKKVSLDEVKSACENHGFTLGGRNYEIKGTYRSETNGLAQERTTVLDSSDETINIIPSIVVPAGCIDADNYPIFSKMQELVKDEMTVVKKEAKI
jgi:hypothetical protein